MNKKNAFLHFYFLSCWRCFLLIVSGFLILSSIVNVLAEDSSFSNEQLEYEKLKVSILKDKIKDINAVNVNGNSILAVLIKQSNVKILTTKLHPMVYNIYNASPGRSIKVDKDALKLIAIAISKGANVNSENKFKATPLMIASMDGKIEIVKMLIQNGAKINQEDEFGRTALLFATQYRRYDVIKYLLKKGAKKTSTKLSVLDAAVSNGDVLLVEFFIKHGIQQKSKKDALELLDFKYSLIKKMLKEAVPITQPKKEK